MFFADLHIHSRFSRATSRDCDLPHLEWWALRKGIRLIGTGDFTHPLWRAELKEQLVPAEEGLYRLREEMRLPGIRSAESPRFIVTGEISSIYKRDGKTRKVHNLILLPDLEAADELSAKLEAIGNIRSDGRPILGVDGRDLLELILETCPDAELIPAHIWTPHFSMFGAFSGFDTIEACFADMTPHIHAAETGLSSDPPMNWRVSALDRLTLISNSDAHSPAKLGREANLMDAEFTYSGIVNAIRTGNGFLGTIEFFPEEGKYHLDGHRGCGVCFTPTETDRQGGICPVCGKKLTIGVAHRVEELADRPEGFQPDRAKPFERLTPLPEVIAASTGGSAAGKKTLALYERLLCTLGPEFTILRESPAEEIERIAGSCVAEGIRRLRAGQAVWKPGFDGEYGTVSLLTPAEIKFFSGQLSLFGMEPPQTQVPSKGKAVLKKAKSSEQKQKKSTEISENSLNPEQQTAVTAADRIVAVSAGPGTGKTKTLISRIVYLIKACGAAPEEITAVTFTNQAAAEMRRRLEKQLGGKRAAARMTIGTFHSICLKLLEKGTVISREEALTVAADILDAAGIKQSAKSFLQAVSRIKNGADFKSAGIEEPLYASYCAELQDRGLLDFDDLLREALKLEKIKSKRFTYLLVDEFQDINDVQYELVRLWGKEAKSIFVIGDPDQSIYGFRGASGRCFERLSDDFPDTKKIRLQENYRSSPEILDCALSVIAKNPGAPRILRANCRPGVPVRVVHTADDFSEGVSIAKEIGRMTGGIDMLEAQRQEQGREIRAFSDIAVLCRTHRQLSLIEKCLRHDDIPCVVSGREAFLETEEVRGVLSFFFSLQPEGNGIALETALRLLWNCPPEEAARIRRLCAGRLDADFLILQTLSQENQFASAWLQRAQEWMPLLEKEKPWKLIARWEERYGASAALEALKNTAVFHSSLRDLQAALTLGEENDLHRAAGKGWESGAVALMTLHGAKGLEFPAVFIAGTNAGSIPLDSSERFSDEEEERRLFYVGLTRAREELILTAGRRLSPFLQDLPECVIREEAGKREERIVEQLRLF